MVLKNEIFNYIFPEIDILNSRIILIINPFYSVRRITELPAAKSKVANIFMKKIIFKVEEVHFSGKAIRNLFIYKYKVGLYII